MKDLAQGSTGNEKQGTATPYSSQTMSSSPVDEIL